MKKYLSSSAIIILGTKGGAKTIWGFMKRTFLIYYIALDNYHNYPVGICYN
jgi:hypothetical protein